MHVKQRLPAPLTLTPEPTPKLDMQQHPEGLTKSLLSEDIQPSPLVQLPAEIADDRVAQTIDALREQRCWLCERREQADLVFRMVAGEGK